MSGSPPDGGTPEGRTTTPEPSPAGAIQDAQYSFPYHYLPRLVGGRFRFHEVLGWGHEYLAYQSYVATLLAEIEWSRLLDVGCGDGRLVSILRQDFPDRDIVGLDYSERAVALARVMVPEGNFVAADVTGPDLFNQSFDCATCIETLEHVEPAFLPQFVAGIRRQLKSGAALIVTVPSRNVRLIDKHYQHFTAESLTDVLSEFFEVERIEYLNSVSAVAKAMRMLVTNRLYTLTNPTLLTAFYNFYVRRYSRSSPERGGRVLAICIAK
jgi:ubiquinone/menaquinone biosynthesis C-methylase UbiE